MENHLLPVSCSLIYTYVGLYAEALLGARVLAEGEGRGCCFLLLCTATVVTTTVLYTESFILHIETAGFVHNNSELTLLLTQLEQVIRSRNDPLHITHIWSHTGMPGQLAQQIMKLTWEMCYKHQILMRNLM